MTLGLTAEHLELATTIRKWAERHCPPDVVRAAADGTDRGSAHYRQALAPGLAEQGAFGLHLPEALGGQGYGLPELAVVVEELGRALVPGAFVPTVLASAVLAAAARAVAFGRSKPVAEWIAALADGSMSGAVGLAAGLTGTLFTEDQILIVHGECAPVLGGSLADVLILPAQTPHGEVWVVIRAVGVGLEVAEGDSLDLTRPVATVRLAGEVVPPERQLRGLDRRAVTRLAAVLLGAEASGIADWATATAAEYARIRHQFGRPVGQFQGVKHRCARMLTAAEKAAAAVWDAARTQSGDADRREIAGAVAAVIAPDAAVWCAHQCIQVLGGIGFTWEHAAHLYYRRALSLRALLGPSAGWAEQVATLGETTLGGGASPASRETTLGGGASPGQVDVDDAGLRQRIREELSSIAALSGREQVERLAAGGWVMPHLPRPWGRGAGPLEQVLTDQEMRAAGLRAPALFIGAWVAPALVKYGTQAQQERFLLPTLRGDIIWCQLFSEPGAGSDLAGLTTRAERADGGWTITGQKIWTSLAKQAAWAICIARTDPSAPRHDGITYFLVDMSSPGIEVRPLREITGHSFFNQVFLDGVFVPDDMVVGQVNGGWRVARTTLANERVSLSRSWASGAGVPELLAVARAAGGAQLARVGALVADGQAIDLLGQRVTVKQLSGTEPGATGSVRKLLGMEHAQQVAAVCFELSGASGAFGDGAGAPVGPSGAPDGPYWARQVLANEALTIGGGTTDIQLNIIGERLLGLPRDPEPPPGKPSA